MIVSVKIYGAQKLVEQMGNDGEAMVKFPGGTTDDLFGSILPQHGFTWADFPLLKNWEEKPFTFTRDAVRVESRIGRFPKLSPHSLNSI